MTCPKYKALMMGYLDGELDDEQKKDFEQHIASCTDCTAELEEFENLKQMTVQVTLMEPEDKIWEQYWSNIYNRVERGVGWILLSIAGIFLLIYGGFKIIEEIINDPTIDIILKVTLVALIAGLSVMFVSVLRERFFIRKKDRYDNVRR